MTEFFHRLTPDWVLRAVEAGGFRPTGHCTVLNSLSNRVFDLRLDEEGEDGPRHVVAKFYRPGRWSREAIEAEHRFLFDLQEAEIPVCAPVRFDDGATLHEVEGILYAVWPRTGGRSLDELSDENVDVLGRLLARIHNVGAMRDAPERIELSEETYAFEPLARLEDGFLPPSCAGRYRAAVERVAAAYAERRSGVPFHRIHGDCHLGNLLHGREGWFFLDFDDFVRGPAVQDVWMLAPGRDAFGLRQRERLVAAYREFREFDDRWLGLVEPLRALRFVWYAAWIAQHWEDPAFPDAFPHFGSEDYWQKETRDLEEMVGLVEGARSAPGGEARERGAAGEGEAELTNKDFFWDME
jgi:Ser/Thr protein kinase RdoA (MazF antagonist)